MGTAHTFEEALHGFHTATAVQRGDEIRKVAATLWSDGEALPGAAAAATVLIQALAAAPDDQRPGIVLLLGLLADAEGPHAEAAHTAVQAGLDSYLTLLTPGADSALTQALLFLLSHFGEARKAVLAVADEVGVDPADLSRLDRTLQPPDLDHPVIGRVWPSPALWALDDAERAGDRQWTGMMTPEQITAMWLGDTRTLRSYSGARAVAAVDGAAAPGSTGSLGSVGSPADAANAAVAAAESPSTTATATAPDRGTLGGHAAAFACPVCHGALTETASGAHCAACPVDYPVVGGLLDLSAGAGEGMDTIVLKDPVHVPRYEFVLRPAFLEIMGGNWSGEVSTSDEDAYLTDQLRPTEGPVLDLAAGSGRWTGHIAHLVGSDRVLALDLSGPMLQSLRQDHPDVLAVRGSALTLPFDDAALGAVNCWNALQALPDAETVIAEVGRCLKPGGTFTLLTFTPATDPLTRHFQRRHEAPLRVSLFHLDELRAWLAKAGLAVQDVRTPGSFLFITAVREESPATA